MTDLPNYRIVAWFWRRCSEPDVIVAQDSTDVSLDRGILAHLPQLMQQEIRQYATNYEFPPEFVVLAIAFLLDPDASSFEDCQVGVQREQVYLLQQYRDKH